MNKKNARELSKEQMVNAKEIAIGNLSIAETILYTEPRRNTFTKKDEIYRKKAKKKAIKTLTKKKAQDSIDGETILFVGDNLSHTETIQYAEPCRGTFTKKDKIYRTKTKKKAIKTLRKKSRKRKASEIRIKSLQKKKKKKSKTELPIEDAV